MVMWGNESPPNTIEDVEMDVLSVLIEVGQQLEILGVPAGLDCP